MESPTEGAHTLHTIVDSHHQVIVNGHVARGEHGNTTMKWEGGGGGDV